MEKRIEKLEGEMIDVRIRLGAVESDVKGIKDDIKSIKDDTKWLRRTITNAVITTLSVGVLGGVIGLFFWVIKGGQ